MRVSWVEKRLRHSRVVLAVAILGACGSSKGNDASPGGSGGSVTGGNSKGGNSVGGNAAGGEDAGPSVPIAEADYAVAYAAAICDNVGGCCTKAGAPAPVACKAEYANSIAEGIAAIRKNLTYDASAAGRCIAQLTKGVAACDPSAVEHATACKQAYVGKLVLGSDCDSTRECAQPSNAEAECNLNRGVCALREDDTLPPEPGGNVRCDRAGSLTCGPGLVCGRDFSCVAPLKESEPCGEVLVSSFCGEGLVCDPINLICRKGLEKGACLSGFECDPKTSFCDPCTQTCTPKRANGEACSGWNECQTGICYATGCSDALFGQPGPESSGFCGFSDISPVCPKREPTDEFSWEPTSITGSVYAMWSSSPTDVYAASPAMGLLHSSGGSTWQTQALPNMDYPYGVWGSGTNDVYAVGNTGIYRSTGDGQWLAQKVSGAGTALTFTAVYGTSADHVFVAGFCDKQLCVLKSSGDGNWTSLNFPPVIASSGIVQSMWSPGGDDLYVVYSANLYILRSGQWQRFYFSTGINWVTGIDSELYLTSNPGLFKQAPAPLWSEIDTGMSAKENAHFVLAYDPSTLFLNAYSGQIYESAGATWSMIGNIETAQGLWPASKDELYAYGLNGIARGKRRTR